MPCDSGSRYVDIDDVACEELVIDDVAIDFLEIDDVCLWRKADPPGEIRFDVPGNYTWITPSGYDSVNVCMVGGGGSGRGDSDGDGGHYAGGGYAGEEFSKDLQVEEEITISITVGAGGEPVLIDPSQNGNPGGSSSFGGFGTVSGGAGGICCGGYPGNEGPGPSGCGGGGYKDGKRRDTNEAYGSGGQASSFGNGGDANYTDDTDGFPGGVGAGGGAFYTTYGTISGRKSGAGGRGEVRVRWGSKTHRKFTQVKVSEMTPEELEKYKIRKVS